MNQSTLNDAACGIKTVLNIIEESVNTGRPLTQVCHDHKKNIKAIRAIIKNSLMVNEGEEVVKLTDIVSKTVTGEEQLYYDIFGLNTSNRDNVELPFDLKYTINKVLETIPQRNRVILSRYYGLNGAEAEIMEVIGKDYGVTKERIRQAISKGLKLLRHPDRSNILRVGMYVYTKQKEYDEQKFEFSKEALEKKHQEELKKAMEERELILKQIETPEYVALKLSEMKLSDCTVLSVRVHNALQRYSEGYLHDLNEPYCPYHTLDNLVLAMYDICKLQKVRSLGRQSIEELQINLEQWLNDNFAYLNTFGGTIAEVQNAIIKLHDKRKNG